ncbi:hypothetical protein D6D54_05275 [Spiroplasma poulsonii]|uniref:Uncharacterized protein n=1 Tax=Spiroplasma poulsonii TaxID=2138 RepID=A0A433EQA1_9MOLU|nr:hypothetical protein [Spiroplasma poulsonii]MBW3059211.1 hypothetical protein [Spiroplasma poulsonii]RUP76615.1 hypothetical protein D6D54_05275 [Spiroplasma poulsonii]
MTKTVKEEIDEELQYLKIPGLMTYKPKYVKEILLKIKSFYENEIVEKNEYINFLENIPGNHDCKNCPNRNNELEQKLLIVDLIKTYKYEIIKYQRSQYNDNKTIEIGMLKFVIKDLEKLFGIQNHKLPSKECD